MTVELAPRTTPGPYDLHYSSVIHDLNEGMPVVVALKEDLRAFAEDHRITSGPQATGAMTNLYQGMPFQRVAVGQLRTDNFAFGKVIETSRPTVRNPERTHGLRLDCLDAVLRMIDEQAAGEAQHFHGFKGTSATLIREFAGAVILKSA